MGIVLDLQFAHDVFDHLLRFPKGIMYNFNTHFNVKCASKIKRVLSSNHNRTIIPSYPIQEKITYSNDVSIYVVYGGVLHHRCGRNRNPLGDQLL